MAIPVLNHMDFQKTAEIRNVKLHAAAEGDITSPGTGQIIYDSGVIKYYNGTSWVTLAQGTSGEINQNAFSFVAVGGQTTIGADGKTDTLNFAPGSNVTITTNATSDTVTISVADPTAAQVTSALVSATSISSGDQATIQANLDVDPAGTDNSTNVTLAGAYDYITISGQTITVNQVDYSTDVTNKPSIPSAANDATITINAGDGLQTGGAFTTDQSADEIITIDVDGTVVRTSGAQTIGGDKTFSNNVIVSGNLTVSGSTTTVNSNEVNIGDSIILLNSDETGTPTQDGGIEIERGTSDNAKWVWDEGNDRWTAYTNNGTTDTLANAQAATFFGTLSGNASTASTLQTARTISLSGDVTGSVSFNGSSNVSISTTVADDSHNHVISNVDGLQGELDAKAPLASPALTGSPTAPTAAASTDSTQIATTAFTQDAIDARTYVTSVGGATSIAVTHGLGTKDVIVQLYDISSSNTVFADVTRNSTSQVTLGFATAPSASSIRVLVSKIV